MRDKKSYFRATKRENSKNILADIRTDVCLIMPRYKGE